MRAPVLAADAAGRAGAPARDGSLLPDDPRVRAAIAVSSTELTASLARTSGADRSREARRLAGKLLRYLIRMSTRPTPYGLFAGVGLVEWGDRTTLAFGGDGYRTRTRPDMEWLLDFVASLESDPDVRAGLRLVATSSVVIRGGRAFLTGNTGEKVSVRATDPCRRALELARTPISPAALAEALGAAPNATPVKAERLVEELWRQGFLLADLRPPLTSSDPARHVVERLQGIPAARSTATALAGLLEQLEAWDALGFEERAESWPDLLAGMRALHDASPSTHLLQTDMALPLTGVRVNPEVAAEAARAAELLLRLSPFPHGLPQLDTYRRAFEARYGIEREVPLLELVDPDFGLGPPDSLPWDGIESAVARREPLLRSLALDALRDRTPVLELDHTLLSGLETWAPDAALAPVSLDISLFVAADSPGALDAGDFNVVVGPNLGGGSAGRNLGRFVDLLGAPAEALLRRISDAETDALPGRMIAEVVYQPQRERSANVAIRRTVRGHEIVFDALAGVGDEQVIPAGELVVGLRSGRFVVRWPARDVEIVGAQGHMLTTLQAPPAARLLLDLANDGRCLLSPFSWGPAAMFPFLPRVQSGRVVLALAEWRIQPNAEEVRTEDRAGFADSLAAWRERWSVPRHVYLASGDHRLLLDLDDPLHAEVLRDELSGGEKGRATLLQEALPGPMHAWLPAPDGGRLVEIVVPVTLRGTAAVSPPPGRSTRPADVRVSDQTRLRLPGSEWLFLKLYAPRVFEDELIAGPLRTFSEFATGAGLTDGWFFLRYADPDPHLRVRFHGEPATLLGPLMEQICSWAGDLVADGLCTAFGFDTYEREVERYGGDEGMCAAEAVFTADSPAVAGMLHLSRQGTLSADTVTLAVLSVDDLLAALGLDGASRTDFYGHTAEQTPEGGREYRARQHELRDLMGRPEALAETSGGGELRHLLAARRAALASAAAWLAPCRPDEASLAPVCRSYVHLHANRLLGASAPDERLVLELLRRVRTGLSKAPVAAPEPHAPELDAPHRV